MRTNSMTVTAGRLAATIVAALVLTSVAPPANAAQGSRVGGSLEGSVKDSSGGAIAKAAVTLRDIGTDQTRTVATDDEGFFRAEQLPVGAYEVRVSFAGFATYRITSVELTLGSVAHLDIL